MVNDTVLYQKGCIKLKIKAFFRLVIHTVGWVERAKSRQFV